MLGVTFETVGRIDVDGCAGGMNDSENEVVVVELDELVVAVEHKGGGYGGGGGGMKVIEMGESLSVVKIGVVGCAGGMNVIVSVVEKIGDVGCAGGMNEIETEDELSEKIGEVGCAGETTVVETGDEIGVVGCAGGTNVGGTPKIGGSQGGTGGAAVVEIVSVGSGGQGGQTIVVVGALNTGAIKRTSRAKRRGRCIEEKLGCFVDNHLRPPFVEFYGPLIGRFTTSRLHTGE